MEDLGYEMAETITYYAMLRPRSTVDDPSGLARRIEDEEIREEALHAGMQWHRTGTIAQWKHGKSSAELVEISEDDAQRVIERAGALADGRGARGERGRVDDRPLPSFEQLLLEHTP